MPQITVNADCDHAPKKQRLRDLNIAFCDICQFSSATGEQIQTLTSYAIETNEGV